MEDFLASCHTQEAVSAVIQIVDGVTGELQANKDGHVVHSLVVAEVIRQVGALCCALSQLALALARWGCSYLSRRCCR